MARHKEKARNGTRHPPALAARRSVLEPALARRLLLGVTLIVLMVVSVGGWAATTPIGGAVIASGFVVVESNIKKVQHPTGGIVAEINVKNGNLVNAGDVVISLDDTQARANLGIVVSQLVQLRGRKARLEAERDQTDQVRFPPASWSGEDAAGIMEGEKRLFEVRQSVKNGQIAQFNERIGQLKQEIKGTTAQRDAKAEEVDLMRDELERLEAMRKKDLVPTTRTLQAQRDLTRLRGEWGAHIAPDCAIAGPDQRNRVADHRRDPKYADGCQQGTARARGTRCRADGAQGCRRRSAEAHLPARAADRICA